MCSCACELLHNVITVSPYARRTDLVTEVTLTSRGVDPNPRFETWVTPAPIIPEVGDEHLMTPIHRTRCATCTIPC
ncbi:hypothetical protein AERO9AM_70036 [Aeromicrobium sp. 9AM]|nr:hypothetical protein AERO9AM_70036 [Aeromicrobium sp. 9AM]